MNDVGTFRNGVDAILGHDLFGDNAAMESRPFGCAALFGLIVLGTSLWLASHTSSALMDPARPSVAGVITHVRHYDDTRARRLHGNTGTHVDVSYDVRGRTYTRVEDVSDGEYKKGDRVTVHYSADDPDNAQVDDFLTDHLASEKFGVLLGAVIAIPATLLWIALVWSKTKRRRTEHER